MGYTDARICCEDECPDGESFNSTEKEEKDVGNREGHEDAR